ncbi:response regulator [Pedobacter endophyticus]|uniref:Response regulator transcription factor n=1 Tax=Pedobacter endophyticus TaxID=2789740 RepID=A0A7U3SQF6_9SPHI|nr:response regulator [Pedobacter endophyticus]QPH38914.1 response regulator transcription factor [Pedobacter endophyticus]
METKKEKIKILICDDEEDILAITEYILTESGYNVIAINNSLMVIEEIGREMPNLVLLDLSMPKLTGDEIVADLKSDPAFQKIPVIIFSANRNGRKVAMEAGADDFIDKPFDIDVMLKILENHTIFK